METLSTLFIIVSYIEEIYPRNGKNVYLFTFLSSFIYWFICLYKGDTASRLTTNKCWLLWTCIFIESTTYFNNKLVSVCYTVFRSWYFDTSTANWNISSVRWGISLFEDRNSYYRFS